MWNGKIPEIERKIQCVDGNVRTFVIQFHLDESKQFYTTVLHEKPEEMENLLEDLFGTSVEEEYDKGFGQEDNRAYMYEMHRWMGRYPTKPHDPEACAAFLQSLVTKYGPESDTLHYEIVDMYIEDIYEAYVYRSPLYALRFGDSRTIMERLKTNKMTVGRVWGWIKQLISGNLDSSTEIQLLTADWKEVATMRVSIAKSGRYFGMVCFIQSIRPYRPPQSQEWHLPSMGGWHIFS